MDLPGHLFRYSRWTQAISLEYLIAGVFLVWFVLFLHFCLVFPEVTLSYTCSHGVHIELPNRFSSMVGPAPSCSFTMLLVLVVLRFLFFLLTMSLDLQIASSRRMESREMPKQSCKRDRELSMMRPKSPPAKEKASKTVAPKSQVIKKLKSPPAKRKPDDTAPIKIEEGEPSAALKSCLLNIWLARLFSKNTRLFKKRFLFLL